MISKKKRVILNFFLKQIVCVIIIAVGHYGCGAGDATSTLGSTPTSTPGSTPTSTPGSTPTSTSAATGAPAAFTVFTTTDKSIAFSWTNNAEDALLITIEMCVGAGCTNFAEIAASPIKPTTTAYTATDLTSNTTYRFRISATSSSGCSDYLTSSNITTLMMPNLSLSSTATAESITLNWVVDDTTGTGIEVQRCNGASCTDFRDTFSSPIGHLETAYEEGGLSETSTYRFRVRVVQGTSSYSNWLTSSDITTLPVAPTGMTAVSTSNTAIDLAWTNHSQTATDIQIQRCIGNDCTDFVNVAASPLPAIATTYGETGLVGGTTYSYRIRAIAATTSSDWLTSGNITTPGVPVDPASCASPTTVVVNKGLKEGALSVGRGLWSDTAIIPGTQKPATAYYDGSTTGGNAMIKFSYADNNDFVVESVAGDAFVGLGSATWVKLAFLTVGENAGRPIIVWTTGSTTVKAAMRSAPIGTEGTWFAQKIDTNAVASRAASISVSPLDQVSIVYLSDNAVTGRARFIYCDAGCSSLSEFTPMDAGATIENTAQATGILGIETAWCKFDATTYYPAAVYHATPTATAFQYAVCTSPDLSTCGAAGGWTKSTVVTPVAAPVSVKLYIDPTVTQDTVKILAKPAAATALTTYTSATGCDNPGLFTAGVNVVGAATAGTGWYKLMKDASGMWHVVSNDGLTSVAYMNSNSTNYQATTWNAAGTIETVALPAGGSGVGGADVAKDDAIIYASYGMNASPYNINLGVVGDITTPSNNVAAIYYVLFPDLTGNINLNLIAGGQTRNLSVANTSTGKPGIAYVDFSLGTVANGWLQYAFRDGTTSDSEWISSSLPISNAASPSLPSLAYDHNDKPWISFFNLGTFRYSLATNTSSDGTGTWNIYQLPVGAKTAAAVGPATDDTAMAMYYNDGVAQPVVIFMNSTATGGAGIRSIKLNPNTGRFDPPVTIDSMGASFGTRLSADYDTNGNIVIAYYDLTTKTLKFNFSTNGGISWKPASAQITATGVGREGVSVKLNPSNSRPSVSYYNRAANAVYYNTCTTALSSCGIAGNWTQTLAQGATAVGVSGIAATTNEQILNTSLTFSASGVPYISYMTGIAPTEMDVGLVVTDSTTGFTPTLPVSLATDTTSSSVTPGVGVAPMHFNQNGINVCSVRNNLGQLINAHIGPNNWLYVTSCGD